MKDFNLHALLFALVSAVIVLSNAFFAEHDERKALASFPRRYAVFVLGCALLAGVLLFLEATFASID